MMRALYFDSSGLVKRYVKEEGSQWVVDVTSNKSEFSTVTSLISSVEVVAAICKCERMGSISPEDAALAISAFKAELRQNTFGLLQVSQQIVDRAMNLAQKHGLRGYDAVQLSSAMALHLERQAASLAAPEFISSDDRLNVAAASEGLPVFNPRTLAHEPETESAGDDS